MDFKALNEELKDLLEDGFAVSGKRDEVTDILSKLTQEYGDLTIPEFIDMLIKKEEKGEDVLNENIPDDDTGIGRYYYWTMDNVDGISHGKITNLFAQYLIKQYSNIFSEYDPYTQNDASTHRGYIKIRLGRLNGGIRILVGVDRLSTNTGKLYLVGDYGTIYHPEDLAKDKFYKSFCKQFKEITHNRDVGFILANTLFEYTESGVSEGISDLANNFVGKLKQIELEQKEKESQIDQELAELKKAKQTAKNNQMTVRQALSKSGVAKKIRALQNPTQEQLAKILAAIEG